MIPAPQNNTVMLGDCVALMRGLAAQSVDLALSDSAYINRGERPSCLSALHQGPASL
jgi:hypothetical protein